VFLIDDDQPGPRRREHRRARADDDARLAVRDPLALVASLGLREPRVQDRHSVTEARAHAADRLGRKRDLGHEHDRAQPPLQCCGARLQVDLRLPRAGRAVQKKGAAARVDRADDAFDRDALFWCELARLGLAAE
jgi:hypothetical protein